MICVYVTLFTFYPCLVDVFPFFLSLSPLCVTFLIAPFLLLYVFFWLLAFTVLSSSHSMGEFATALPLQGTYSKSLSGFALIRAFTLYTISDVSLF